MKNYFLILIVICFSATINLLHAQVDTTAIDTDSVYNKIEDFSQKKKLTKWLHGLIFESTERKPKRKKVYQRVNIGNFEGKIIRDIKIRVFDPFGFSLDDTLAKPNNWAERVSNNLHIRTRSFVIRNILLFEENSKFDSVVIYESERLLRTQNYVQSVKIYPKRLVHTSDSVDITVDVLDTWTIIPDASLSSSKVKLGIRERNFIGLGHQLRADFSRSLKTDSLAYDLRYRIPNFRNTYISGELAYKSNLAGEYGKLLDIERTFFSPLTRWAGGFKLDKEFHKLYYPENDSISVSQNLNSITQDYWAGYAFRIYKGFLGNNRIANLVTSLRFLDTQFSESPSLEYDSINYFADQRFYLASIGISLRQFVRDNYIFQDGRTEDVPIGAVGAITLGNQSRNGENRNYLGTKLTYGDYYSWGFLSTNFEFGTFFNNSKAEQTAYSFQANYFTNLISIGEKWHMRQFVKPQFLIGTSRLDSEYDMLTLNENNNLDGFFNNDYPHSNRIGIPGFKSDLRGTKKYLLALQTQFYSPWNLYGFRLNPFVNITTALIADDDTRISKSKLYSSFGIGFLVRNDYLVFSSFQISLAYYPNMPGKGVNIFRGNALESNDFGFQEFNLGKPLTVNYN
ncbi:BamA/TamA family outer membrane protein [Aegicerativicinus sediminis]|uniref:hypothetical protein n=1 Tax=Aegicerativicinus sediminis TaxID=2893202 RepID=UPI001E4970B4|nr:hypothetical protein [Aegicerativicinus sediminis]